MGSAKLKKIIAEDKNHLFQNYGDRQKVCFVRGQNSYLYDQDNKKYVDFFSGILLEMLGVPVDLFTCVFAMSRAAGWCAHWVEQVTHNRLYRPAQEYIGDHNRPYVPLEER